MTEAGRDKSRSLNVRVDVAPRSEAEFTVLPTGTQRANVGQAARRVGVAARQGETAWGSRKTGRDGEGCLIRKRGSPVREDN